MTDDVIYTHGHAALLELLLRDAFISGDHFLQQAQKHLLNPCYSAMGADFENFKLALYEYIMSICDGKKTLGEVIEILSQAVPQEREIMLTFAEQLRQEGRLQGIQQGIHQGELGVARKLIKAGVDVSLVKQATHLSDEELSPIHSKNSQAISQLQQVMSSTVDSTTLGEVAITTTSTLKIGDVRLVPKRHRDT